ncbi:PP2C family protein-serine/threonine phosphatase [Streptomyces sp. NPDC059718]
MTIGRPPDSRCPVLLPGIPCILRLRRRPGLRRTHSGRAALPPGPQLLTCPHEYRAAQGRSERVTTSPGRTRGRVTFPDLPAGTPLGVGLGAEFEAVEPELPERSLLALYTDGLVETRDHDIDVGMNLLGSALAQRKCSLEDLCTRALRNLTGHGPSDDVTLLLVRTRSLGPEQVAQREEVKLLVDELSTALIA